MLRERRRHGKPRPRALRALTRAPGPRICPERALLLEGHRATTRWTFLVTPALRDILSGKPELAKELCP
ncbi:hypothetical protein [Sorangium sp. So ce1097]|uniref:hypothetical protein n=1 Tax=Sorangium sp. So ce1097 TaxID=3133330 RepID=UPI003F5ECE77